MPLCLCYCCLLVCFLVDGDAPLASAADGDRREGDSDAHDNDDADDEEEDDDVADDNDDDVKDVVVVTKLKKISIELS